METNLKILVLTQVFPNSAMPHRGSFISERVRLLSESADIRVINPVPYCPPVPGLGRYSRLARVGLRGQTPEGCLVTHPRYLVPPKVATFVQGWTMSHAVRRHLAADAWRPDIIDAHFAFPDGYAAVRLGQSLGCPVIVTCHGTDLSLYPRLVLTGRMMHWTMRHAARVIGVAPHLRDKAIDLGCTPAHALMLPNGVDCDMFTQLNRLQCRTELNLPIDRPIALCIGSLDDNKNQAVLIEALALLKADHTPMHLALVGTGRLKATLEKLADRLLVASDVTLAGPRPYAEVPTWLGACDWLVLASRREGWPSVYFEAMACGRPVITSGVAAARYAIDRGDLGTVVAPNTPHAWALALDRAHQIKWNPQAIRLHAMNHSWSHWACSYLALVHEVLGRHQYTGAAA